MLTSLQDYFVLLALIALPGAVSWWSGRRLARRVDNPALPELLAAHGRLNGVMLIIAIAGLMYVAPWRLSALAIPLAFAGLIASAYPLRRVLFDEMPSATVLLVALAGAIGCSKVRRMRLVAAAVGVVALATTLAASTAFLDRFETDPFLIDAPALEWVAVGSDALGEFDVPSGTSRINLSPDGRYVAAYQDADSGDEDSSSFHVGRIGEPLTAIAAHDVAFVDDDRLLAVESDSRGTTLRILSLGSSHDVIWQEFVEGLSAPSLFLDRAAGRWRVMGWGHDESLVRVEGVIGTSGIRTKRWPAAYTRGDYIAALTTAGSDVLVVETRYDRTLLSQIIPWPWTWGSLLQPYNHAARYATVSDRGRRMLGESKLDANCMADVLDDGLVCAVYDGTRTHLVEIDAGTGRVEGIGLLDGQFMSDRNVVRGWLTGWAGARVVAIRLSTREVLYLPQRRGATTLLSVANGQLAAVTLGDEHFTVRLYPLPPETPIADTMRAQRTLPSPRGQD